MFSAELSLPANTVYHFWQTSSASKNISPHRNRCVLCIDVLLRAVSLYVHHTKSGRISRRHRIIINDQLYLNLLKCTEGRVISIGMRMYRVKTSNILYRSFHKNKGKTQTHVCVHM
ncbi:hypothetical protein GDO86_013080 [Hymenochirus boettgeri]|uniref:Uncharacterized protein n=1 Tax=Hymenochirus boettgeri TaxID=247094 RepID=A0A8T2IPU9_9PIPI|nr:hypothetical protein GDO86_013080 [Hymenochirus boettgeri]